MNDGIFNDNISFPSDSLKDPSSEAKNGQLSSYHTVLDDRHHVRAMLVSARITLYHAIFIYYYVDISRTSPYHIVSCDIHIL